ncbi:MAG: tRNA adenosine(34) deaminase TadA [Desulfovibrio sp.]
MAHRQLKRAEMRPEPPDTPPGGFTWESLMEMALLEARKAAEIHETPIGAVLLSPEGEIIAKAHNRSITDIDPSAHAEMQCLRIGAEALQNYRLRNCIMVVTLEPCIMCLGAMLHARIAGVVYAATDPKTGTIHSNLDGCALPFSNHKIWAIDGIYKEKSVSLIQSFFRERRARQKELKKLAEKGSE